MWYLITSHLWYAREVLPRGFVMVLECQFSSNGMLALGVVCLNMEGL